MFNSAPGSVSRGVLQHESPFPRRKRMPAGADFFGHQPHQPGERLVGPGGVEKLAVACKGPLHQQQGARGVIPVRGAFAEETGVVRQEGQPEGLDQFRPVRVIRRLALPVVP